MRKWVRVILHFWKLLSLSTPLVATAPLMLVCRSTAPGVEEKWWSYAVWAAQYASPAVLKFLQWASTRRDMFPAAFCDRFSHFQEHAPKHSWEQTEDALCMAFGDDWNERIAIDREPIGSGCIAQVYRARLRDTNERIAVKVIHPEVKRLVALDLDLMRGIVALVECVPQLQWLSAREGVEEFATLMNRQLNLRDEAHNLVRFGEHFQHRKGLLRFPRPNLDLTTDNVLIETFEEGLHFNELFSQLDAQDRKQVAHVVLESYLRMVFLDNFSHGDLHPGNLIFDMPSTKQKVASSTKAKTSVVAIDAGIVTRLDPAELRNLVELFHAVATGNGYRAGELIVLRSKPRVSHCGKVVSEAKCRDLDTFCRGMERIVSESLRFKLKLEKVHVGALLREVMELCCTHEVKLDGKYASIVVSIVVLEAVGRKLDPDIDILSVALPIIAQSLVKHA